jgi:hypothetical protein
MPQLVADLDNLQVQWGYSDGKKVADLLVWNAEMTEILKTVRISNKVAEILAEHGMSSGS